MFPNRLLDPGFFEVLDGQLQWHGVFVGPDLHRRNRCRRFVHQLFQPTLKHCIVALRIRLNSGSASSGRSDSSRHMPRRKLPGYFFFDRGGLSFLPGKQNRIRNWWEEDHNNILKAPWRECQPGFLSFQPDFFAIHNSLFYPGLAGKTGCRSGTPVRPLRWVDVWEAHLISLALRGLRQDVL